MSTLWYLPDYSAPDPYNGSPFGGVRVAADLVFRDNTHLYPGPATAYDPEMYGFEQTNGTCTHLPNESASGDKARLRTHDQSGAATLVEIACYCADTGKTNQVRRWGLYDDADGVFSEREGTSTHLVVRSSTTQP